MNLHTYAMMSLLDHLRPIRPVRPAGISRLHCAVLSSKLPTIDESLDQPDRQCLHPIVHMSHTNVLSTDFLIGTP